MQFQVLRRPSLLTARHSFLFLFPFPLFLFFLSHFSSIFFFLSVFLFLCLCFCFVFFLSYSGFLSSLPTHTLPSTLEIFFPFPPFCLFNPSSPHSLFFFLALTFHFSYSMGLTHPPTCLILTPLPPPNFLSCFHLTNASCTTDGVDTWQGLAMCPAATTLFVL